MSVRISINKAILEEFPELTYQLFYLSSDEEKTGLYYVYTAKAYYRELTDLLDVYGIPYKIYSSKDLSLLHVLLIEEDGLLAWDLKEQLEKWGFGLVEISNQNYFSLVKRKHFSLTILDKQSIRTLSLVQQLRISIKLFPAPIILIVTLLQKRHPNLFAVINKSQVLQKPFSISELRQTIERLLNIALIPLSEQKG